MFTPLVLLVAGLALVVIVVTATTPTFLEDLPCYASCLITFELSTAGALAGLLLVLLLVRRLSGASSSPLLDAPALPSPTKRKLNTVALDGLRGFTTVYVGIYHYIQYFDRRVDLIATCLMNFFYLLSGFVMTLGYGDRAFDTIDFFVKRFARIAPMYFLTNIPMYFAQRYFYHASSDLLLKSGILGLTFTSTFTFAHYTPWNYVTWTIQIFVFCYACYPCIAPLLRRLAQGSYRSCAAVCYVVYLIIALVVFAGLTTRAGWTGAGQAGLDFGSAYNTAFVNVPVFVMGCCAGFDAVRGTPLPSLLRQLYSCGGCCSIASGAMSGCVALFVIGIWSVQRLTLPADPGNPYSHGGGESTVATFVIMLLVPPLGYDLIISLCADVQAKPATEVELRASRSGEVTSIVPIDVAAVEGSPAAHLPQARAQELVVLLRLFFNGWVQCSGDASLWDVALTEGWAVAFFRWKPLLWIATIRRVPSDPRADPQPPRIPGAASRPSPLL